MARSGFYIDAVGRCDYLWVESSSVGEQAVIRVALELLSVSIVVRSRHYVFLLLVVAIYAEKLTPVHHRQKWEDARI